MSAAHSDQNNTDGSSFVELPSFLLFPFDKSISAEQKCGTPNTCQADNGVNQPAEQGTLTTKEPSYQVELENTDQSPVQTSDDR